jgi:hypothetical protein
MRGNMKITLWVYIIFLIPGLSLAASNQTSVACDFIATVASTAAQARIDGKDFSSILKNIEELDFPAEVKVGIKMIVADTYSKKLSPASAYSETLVSCVRSLKE